MTREIDAPVSVTEPVGKAIEEVKKILFSPFNPQKWFIIGFCAWLAYLGTTGGGGGGGGNFNVPSQSPAEGMEQAKAWIVSNLPWLIPVILIGLTVCLMIGLVFSWLNSRGQFMFLHCVAKNVAQVSIPWTQYSEQGNSLFLFRIVLWLISFGVIILYLVLAGAGVFALSRGSEPDLKIATIAGIVVGVLGLICLIILFELIKKFTLDFVAPIMYLRMSNCTAAWREFMEILSARKGAFTVYILFYFVLNMAIGALLMTVILVTCFCACCFLAIPYIWAVLLLPVLIFKRAYSLHFLRQFGSDFDVFTSQQEVNPAPTVVM